MNILKTGTGFKALGVVTTGPRRPIRTAHFDLDAPHRGRDNRTHLTHWPAANCLDFSRVRSECGEALLFIHHDLLEFQARAIWMLPRDPAAMMKAMPRDMARHRQTILRTALRGSHAALALAFTVRGETSATWLGRKVL